MGVEALAALMISRLAWKEAVQLNTRRRLKAKTLMADDDDDDDSDTDGDGDGDGDHQAAEGEATGDESEGGFTSGADSVASERIYPRLRVGSVY